MTHPPKLPHSSHSVQLYALSSSSTSFIPLLHELQTYGIRPLGLLGSEEAFKSRTATPIRRHYTSLFIVILGHSVPAVLRCSP